MDFQLISPVSAPEAMSSRMSFWPCSLCCSMTVVLSSAMSCGDSCWVMAVVGCSRSCSFNGVADAGPGDGGNRKNCSLRETESMVEASVRQVAGDGVSFSTALAEEEWFKQFPMALNNSGVQ